MKPAAIPNIIDLVNKRLNGDVDEARRFFDLKGNPTQKWRESLKPGLDAAQRVIGPFIAEQNGEDPQQHDIALVATDAAARTEHETRKKLTEAIFGHGRDLAFLSELLTSIKSKPVTRIEFLPKEEGGLGRRVAVTFPALEQQGEAPAVAVAPRSQESLLPAPGGEAGPVAAGLDALVRTMAPRVRLEGAPANPETVLQAVADGRWTREVALLLPMYGSVNPHVVFSLLAQVRKQPWMGVHYETDTIIQRARNILADKFLKSEAKWSFWLDSDVIAPFGEPAFFYDPKRLNADPTFLKPEATGLMALERLRKAEKTIVGGVYQARRAGGEAPIIIQPCLHPRDAKDKEVVEELRRSGPINRVMQVSYIATGLALIHKQVFIDIKQAFPERQPENPGEPYDFFGHDVGRGGEDISFCGLANQAGHASFLDLGCWGAHLGNYAFFPERKL